MVLLEQLSALIDYLENNPELALGHKTRTLEERSLRKQLWAECAQILNSAVADGPNKSPDEWRAFFNEYKFKLTKKLKLQKRGMSATGGNPARKIILTPLQERLYNILVHLGEPLAGVSHNPLPVGTSHQPSKGCLPKPARRYPAKEKDYDTLESSQTALDATQTRLEQIEAKNAEAMLAQAQATENLAAAINGLGTAITQAADKMAAAIEKVGDCYKIETIDKSS